MLVYVIIYILIGFFMGGFGTLLFFRFDKQWKQVATGIVDLFGSGGIGMLLAAYFDIPREKMGIPIMAMLFAAFGAVVVAFEYLSFLLKKENDDIPIRKLDIILGYNEFLKHYYDHRDKQNDLYRLDKREKELEAREVNVKNVEGLLQEQIKEGVYISLPENVKIPITNHFINLIPTYVDHVYRFKRNTFELTNQVVEKLNDKTQDNSAILKGYFAGIGMYVSNDLFGLAGDNDEVRTHFRVYKNGKHIQYSVVMGSKPTQEKIHDIPGGPGTLIRKSYEIRSSIIASLNETSVFDVKTEWGDFMTFSYYKLKKEGEPFLSMGISVKNKEQFAELLMFLNFYKIEKHLQKMIDNINEKCSIIDSMG